MYIRDLDGCMVHLYIVHSEWVRLSMYSERPRKVDRDSSLGNRSVAFRLRFLFLFRLVSCVRWMDGSCHTQLASSAFTLTVFCEVERSYPVVHPP